MRTWLAAALVLISVILLVVSSSTKKASTPVVSMQNLDATIQTNRTHTVQLGNNSSQHTNNSLQTPKDTFSSNEPLETLAEAFRKHNTTLQTLGDTLSSDNTTLRTLEEAFRKHNTTLQTLEDTLKTYKDTLRGFEDTVRGLKARSKYSSLREEGLKALKEFLVKDHLEGFAERGVVEEVCGHIEKVEVKQMCRVRGRRMGERLLKYHKKGSLDKKKADDYGKWMRKAGGWVRMSGRVRIVNGTVHSWEEFEERNMEWTSNVPEMVAMLKKMERSGAFKKDQTFEMMFQPRDNCFNYNALNKKDRFKYPLVGYSAADWCPEHIPLLWVLDRQTSKPALNPANNIPFLDRKDQVYFRGNFAWRNTDRLYFAALAATDRVGFLNYSLSDSKARDRGQCTGDLANVRQRLPRGSLKDSLTASLCGPSSRIWGKATDYDERLKYKYQLNIDGQGALFRLGPNLQSNSVNFFYKNKGLDLPFDQDMIPYVHYIPLPTDLGKEEEVRGALVSSFEWLDENKDVGRQIAEESTRWGKLHASEESHARDFQLYAAWLTYLQKPDAFRDYESVPKMTFDKCDNYEAFLKNDWVGILKEKWKLILYHVTCYDPPFNLNGKVDVAGFSPPPRPPRERPELVAE